MNGNEASNENIVAAKKQRDKVTVKRQILTNVRKSLATHAAKNARTTGEYIPPTKAEVRTECLKRWHQHLDRMKGKEDVSEYFD